ncbi:hypothetical protein [Lactobacillus selangorensis]|nr:hypothetical protein [Lactobacillus selangorensis]KRN31861.1 hypothetical protein IV40_GL001146 [Lactobacillus selangorensis]
MTETADELQMAALYQLRDQLQGEYDQKVMTGCRLMMKNENLIYAAVHRAGLTTQDQDFEDYCQSAREQFVRLYLKYRNPVLTIDEERIFCNYCYRTMLYTIIHDRQYRRKLVAREQEFDAHQQPPLTPADLYDLSEQW